ncbi:hypothetical protein [Streptomyces sp. NPDC093589]|uniref:hypothetical protein n=1 Tax=Streptomyces sp. NPDC093589 TaxID=3366043 RepID=UPI00382E0C6B
MEPSKELATITNVESAAERVGTAVDGELAYLAPAAAAALNMLADAIERGGADHYAVIEALKDAGVHTAFAGVLDAAGSAVTDAMDDPYDFDDRLNADNLSAAAREVRDAFNWL